MKSIQKVQEYLLNLQETIATKLEILDGTSKFTRDVWQKPEGGNGKTYALENGPVIEKCGVNFSYVFGNTLPKAATDKRPELAGQPFQATGLSLIVHPRNPYAPTVHFNLRFFISEQKNQAPIWWFGGGFDLTPYYGFTEDCIHWHQTAKNACDPFGKELYPKYKKWADEYFYLKHRQEPRGIGGIFFDDLTSEDFEKTFQCIQSIGDHFLPAYLPILEKRMTHAYGERQRDFQNYRRGRYVEFNLLYDRGTLFGLQFGGRTESILISLPPVVHWHYAWHPMPGSEESKLYEEFLVAKDWC